MLLGVATLARFSTIVILLVGVLTIIGMLWKTSRSIYKSVNAQLDATRKNTNAIDKLSNEFSDFKHLWPPQVR